MAYSNIEWTQISLVRNIIQRSYEPLQIYFFVSLARAMGANSFWDIGANVGSFSLAMASVPAIKRVHAFEPMPQLHVELAKNVRNNDPRKKILCHGIALSDHDGTVDFAILGAYSGANGVAATLFHKVSEDVERLQVNARKLDSFVMQGHIPPDGLVAIKIDVEGHELAVLKGASDFLQRACLLQVELLASHEAMGSEVKNFLSGLGYHCFWEIGADSYFAPINMCPTDQQLLQILRQSHQDMIDDFHRIEITGINHTDDRIVRRLGPIEIAFHASAARFLRRLFRRD